MAQHWDMMSKLQYIQAYEWVIRQIWDTAKSEENVALRELVDQALSKNGIHKIYKQLVAAKNKVADADMLLKEAWGEATGDTAVPAPTTYTWAEPETGYDEGEDLSP